MSTAQPWVLQGHSETRYWIPEGFDPEWPAEQYRYIVIDELIEEIVTLAVARWPKVDARGRLRFGPRTAAIHVRLADLGSYLAKVRRPPPLTEQPRGPARAAFTTRDLRVGDTFAAREAEVPRSAAFEVSRGEHHAVLINPRRWLERPVYDITGQSRLAAKLMFYSAAARVLRRGAVARQFAEVSGFASDPYDVIGGAGEPGDAEQRTVT